MIQNRSAECRGGEAQPQMRRQIPIPKLQCPKKFQAPKLKASASLTVPPLLACGERIACRADSSRRSRTKTEAQRRREVRGFDRYAKNPHPTLSLSKGEATEGRSPLFWDLADWNLLRAWGLGFGAYVYRSLSRKCGDKSQLPNSNTQKLSKLQRKLDCLKQSSLRSQSIGAVRFFAI
jgi:hypothetical protein